MLEFLMQLDQDLFLFLNGLNTPWLDHVMWWISDKFAWIPFYALLLFFCAKQYGWRVLIIMLLAAVLITLSDQISVFMKFYFERFRPSRDPSLEGLVHLVNEKRGGKYGFVSSHASNSVALATFMIFLLKNRIKYIVPVMVLYAVLKCYSRIYLGVHYPGDVIGGALLGIACGWIVIFMWQMINKKFYPDKYIAVNRWF